MLYQPLFFPPLTRALGVVNSFRFGAVLFTTVRATPGRFIARCSVSRNKYVICGGLPMGAEAA